MLADAGDDVLQHAAPGMMIENVVGGDQRNEIVGGDAGELRHPAADRRRDRESWSQARSSVSRHAASIGRADATAFASSIRAGGMTIRLRPSIRSIRSGQVQDAVALFRFQLAGRQQPRQPSPGGAVGRIGEDVGRAVGEDQPRADRKPQAAFPWPPHARAPRRRPNCGRRCRCAESPRASPAPPVLPDARRRAGRRNWW